MDGDFFAYVSRMKYINRWGLMKNTSPENLLEHSGQTAMIAHALAVINNTYFGGHDNPEKICVYALYHDADETITGDMPTPVKYYNPEIKEIFSKIEDEGRNRLCRMLPDELKSEYSRILNYEDDSGRCKKTVKAADKISAYIKCIEELKSGNMEFSEAKKTIEKDICEMKMPEVDYFMEHFVKSFEKSLDELGGL